MALVVGAVLGIAAWNVTHHGAQGGSAAARPVRLTLLPPPGLNVSGYDVSPDGRTIVALASEASAAPGEEPVQRIYSRGLDRFEFTPIPGTELCSGFAWSPDGKWLAFNTYATRDNPRRKLAKVPTDGASPAIALCDWQDGWNNYIWLPDGDILIEANRSTQLIRVPASGGAPSRPAPTSTADGGSVGQLSFDSVLPGGNGVLVGRESWGAHGYQLDLWLLDPRSGRIKELIRNASIAAYLPSGQLVFTRGDALNAVPFDPRRGVIKGEAIPLMSGLRTNSTWQNATFALGGGNLLYTPGGITGGRRRLMLAGAAGDTTEFTPERGAFERDPAISPDGRRAAVVISNPQGTYEIWLAERGAPGLRPGVAIESADCSMPVWSPDGSRIAFNRNGRDSADGLYVVRAGSGDSPSLILRSGSIEERLVPESWARDGSGLLALSTRAGRGRLLFVPLSSDTPRVARPLRTSTANVLGGRLSPDGQLVAFASEESGTPQIHVARLLPGGAMDVPVPVPSLGAPVSGAVGWSADGRRVMFGTGEYLMAASVTPGPALSAAPPVRLFKFRDLSVQSAQWDVAPDGRAVIICKGEDEGDIRRRDVIVNWESELRDKVARARAGGSRR